MTAITRTFNGHDFSFVTCVCGLTKDEYDDSGQPPCAGPPETDPRMQAANEERAGQAVAYIRRAIAARCGGPIGVVRDNEL
jgi:hypothetical protein